MSKYICGFALCEKSARSLGYCGMHYERLRKNGDPSITRKKPNGYWKNELYSLLAFDTDYCIEWNGPNIRGYGRIFMNGKWHRAGELSLQHRNIYQPEGKPLVLHKPEVCHNPKCINYRHLRWGSVKENAADRTLDGTQMIGSGHPRAKLTEQQAKTIKHSELSDLLLSQEYSVDRKVIWAIKKGKIWKHV